MTVDETQNLKPDTSHTIPSSNVLASHVQKTPDKVETYWVAKNELLSVLKQLKPIYPMLFDLFGIDERHREKSTDLPQADFTVVYHLLSFEKNSEIRIKVGIIERK